MSDPVVTRAGRWRPIRAGIRNIWEYDDQVFDFADGRLVLRGPNGSGKSNALALLVPFLLDGVMAPSRMDSLSGGRSMKTLLLCLTDDERANRFRHEQRTGYAWLEFEGDDEHVSIGCGARASTQRDAEAWFFVTSRRPGIDLDLAPGGVPLSRAGLVDTIGAGSVQDSAEAYRAAVDRTLFGLGAHRYRNLVELLLVLRRPHLAGKLNLEHLSKVLSDGLVALDDQLIADVAASFEDLEAVQRDLARMQEAHRTVLVFLPVYRRYLRAAARTRALAAVEAERRLRAARRRVGDASRAAVAAEEEIARVRLAQLGCDERREVAEQRQRAVLESPAYLDAKSLVEVDARATETELDVCQAKERLAAASGEAEGAAGELAGAVSDVTEATTAVERAFAAAGEAADLAGISWSLARSDVESDDVAKVMRALGLQRRQDLADVRVSLAKAEQALVHQRTTASAAARSVDAAAEAEDARCRAGNALEDERAELRAQIEGWAHESAVTELEQVAAAVELVGEPAAPSLADVVAEVLRPRLDALAAAEARAEDHARSLSTERDTVVEERRRVADDPIPSPDRLATRPADRTGRSGAPLYACCDFAEHVPNADRAGLEAAIEAAGLLDAWVGEHTDDMDAWVGPESVAATPSLADVLVPTPPPGSGLTTGVVGSVLASISLAEAGIAVLADGRFRLGPLSGRFAKPAAEFIGVTAREQRRQRLLTELDHRLDDLARQLETVEQEREEIATEQRRLNQVVASLPSASAVLVRRDALLHAVATARATAEAARRDEAVARDARHAAQESHDALRSLAAARRLPATAEDLSHVERLIHGFEHQANALVTAAAALAVRQKARIAAADRAHRADDALRLRRGEHDDLHRRATGLRARVEQLRAQLGADAEAPLLQLAAIEDELRQLRFEADQLGGAAASAAQQLGGALREQSLAEDAVAEHEAAADGSAARLEVLRRDDVWSVVAADSASGVTEPKAPPAPARGAVELAAAVSAATADVTAEADENALQRAYRHLLDELGRGYDPGLSYVDHLAVVEVTSDAGTFSVLWLAEQLGNQVSRQQELLSERDREIFERHLLTRVSEALRELLNDADELVGRINRSLADRPTASGKTVQLRWELDTADPAVRAAVGLLRKTPELLGPNEREQLRRFFSTAISQRRAEDGASGYAGILRHVLDYRSWYAFVPQVRSAGGGVQRLTRTLFRSLSGGEQAVVLHLPLFAAAAAHYDSAAPTAPRLIALDEAFAGIDEGMRGELMGLLVRFDLDVVLTGHELWGAYEQVPALMVYDLLRNPPLEGVSAFAIRWDGAAMAEV